MFPQILPLFPLIITSLTLSIPPPPSIVLLSSQNETITIPPPSTNAKTTTHLGGWPGAPFSRHLGWHTDLVVLRRTPSPPTDPTPEMGVLEGISLIGAKARARSRTSSIQDFHEMSGPVTFDFHATDDLFSGSDLAMVLDVLWEMTNLYGKGGVYGGLLRIDDYIAYYELALQKVSVAK